MTNNSGRTLAVVGAIVTASAGLVAIALPAEAAQSNCPSGSACIWADSTYRTNGLEGGLKGFAMYVPDYSGWNYAGTSVNANNSATSIYNNGNVETTYWFNAAYPTGFPGPEFALLKIGDGNMSNNEGTIKNQQDNILSSGYFTSYLP